MNREDHRVRMAAKRRERTRAKLMEAALLVFGERGAEAIVIDEVTQLAKVARGTLYNYFRGNRGLAGCRGLRGGRRNDAAHRSGRSIA